MPRHYPRSTYIFLDQDGPLADFEAAMHREGMSGPQAKMLPGFYRSLPVTPGAQAAVKELCSWDHVHVFVATKIPNANPLAATEKIQWLHEHFPELEERIIVTPNKAVIGGPGDFLVDDRHHKADAAFFPGTFVHFGAPAAPTWVEALATLRRHRDARTDRAHQNTAR